MVATVVWAIFGAPKSARRLKGIWYWLLRSVFDAVGAVALYAAGQRAAGVAFALIAALNYVLGYLWKQ